MLPSGATLNVPGTALILDAGDCAALPGHGRVRQGPGLAAADDDGVGHDRVASAQDQLGQGLIAGAEDCLGLAGRGAQLGGLRRRRGLLARRARPGGLAAALEDAELEPLAVVHLVPAPAGDAIDAALADGGAGLLVVGELRGHLLARGDVGVTAHVLDPAHQLGDLHALDAGAELG